LLRSKLRQADTGEETALVPQACITARKTIKTGWRGETSSLFSLSKQPLPYRDDMDGKAVDIDIVLFIKSHNLGYFQWVELVESDKSLHLPLRALDPL
jgi:hypothetical protein